MSNVLLWIGGLLVAALCALFAVPHLVDWNRYRGVFEEEASRMLGREVRVDGKVNLRLLPSPFVRFEKIYVADGEGAVGEPFIRADGFTVWLAISPLLRGAIQANEIALQRPILKLRLAADGGGNWQNLAIGRGSLPFIPNDVTLNSVRVTDGIVVVQDAGGRELGRIDGIAGEATASAIEGPYRFRADFNWNGDAREIKGATAKPEPDGTTRLKASVRVPGSNSTYVFDGRITDIAGTPKLDGELSAKLIAKAAVRATGATAATGSEPTGFDFKSRIDADTSGIRLPGITLGLEQGGRQQSVTGRAEAKWRDVRAVSFEVHSTWFDLDTMLEPGTSPAEALVTLLKSLATSLPADGRVSGRLTGDQLNLGGETLSQARFVIERAGAGPLQVRDLSAAMPGGARTSVQGTIDIAENVPSFEGDISLRGANFSRFAGWMARIGAQAMPGRGEGAFGVHGRLRLSPAAIELNAARAELAGSIMTGGVSYSWDRRRQLTLNLDGSQIDLSAVAPGALDLGGIRDLFAATAVPTARAAATTPPGGAPVASLFKIDLARTDVQLNVRAGRLSDGQRSLRDVTADLTVRNGNVDVTDLRFLTDAGLQFEMLGEVKEAATRPRGRLRGVISMPNRAAGVDLIQMMELPDETIAEGSVLGATVPLRTAYDLRIGERAERSIEGTIDGIAAGAGLRGTLRLDAGLANWRAGAIDVFLTSDKANLGRVLASLLPADEFDIARQDTALASQVSVRAIGPRADAVATRVLIVAGKDLRIEVSGQADLSDARSTAFAGRASLDIADLGAAIASAGLKRQPAVRGIAVRGPVAIVKKGGTWSIEPQALAVAGASLSGSLAVQPVAGQTTISGRLLLSELSVGGLLAGWLDGRNVAVGAQSIWPDGAFNFSAIAGLRGEVRIETPVVKLGSNVAARRAAIDTVFHPDRLEVSRFEATTLGGAVSGTLKLDRAPAGAELVATLRVDRARLDALAASGTAADKSAGTANLALALTGRALTPRSLITAMTGKGEARLSGGTLGRLAPAAVKAAADAALSAKIDASGAPLRQELSQQLAASTLAVAATRIPFDVADGVMKFRPFTIDTADGRVTNHTVVDLTTLDADSEWRIEAKASDGKPALPPVSVVYVGPIGEIAGREGRLTIDAFEREIGVRRMERDVDELERLRKLDEERSKAETERRTQLLLLEPPPPVLSAETPRAITPASGPPADPAPLPGGAAAITPHIPVDSPASTATSAGNATPSVLAVDPRRRPPPPPTAGVAVKKGPAAVYDQLNAISR